MNEANEPLRISIGIDPELYPDLHATLAPLGKGMRSEMLRVLAQEGLLLRRANKIKIAAEAELAKAAQNQFHQNVGLARQPPSHPVSTPTQLQAPIPAQQFAELPPQGIQQDSSLNNINSMDASSSQSIDGEEVRSAYASEAPSYG